MTATAPNYHIYAGETYYPDRGLNDLYGTADTLEKALEIAKEAIEVGSKPSGSWWHKDKKQPMEEYEGFEPNPRDWSQIADIRTTRIVAELFQGNTIRWRDSFDNIREAVTFVLKLHDIKSWSDLDRWCGGRNRNRIYNMVQELASEKWGQLGNPKASVRSEYERMLEEYARHK